MIAVSLMLLRSLAKLLIGIKSIGEDPPNSAPWYYQLQGGSSSVSLRPGYDARQLINHNGKSYEVSCKLKQNSNFGPLFQCEVFKDGKIIFTSMEARPTTTMKKVFEFLNLQNYNKNLSGYEFFGLTRTDVISQLSECSSKSRKRKSNDNDHVGQNNVDNSKGMKRIPVGQFSHYPLLDKLSKTKTRNAGPTSSLQCKSQKERNALVHEAVKFTSFNDVKSYVIYLCENEPDLVTGAITESELGHDIISQLDKIGPRHVSVHDSAEFLLGRTHLSQREYIAARKALQKRNVHLAKYADVAKYASEVDIGTVYSHICHQNDPNVSDDNLDCM